MEIRERTGGERSRTMLICVDSYEQGILSGTFHSLGSEGCCAFHSPMQLLAAMEYLFDSGEFPPAFAAARAQTPLPQPRFEPETPGGPVGWQGRLATFGVRVLVRQHASWQGTVTWLERNREQPFRSVLELLLMMDSALGGCWQEDT